MNPELLIKKPYKIIGFKHDVRDVFICKLMLQVHTLLLRIWHPVHQRVRIKPPWKEVKQPNEVSTYETMGVP